MRHQFDLAGLRQRHYPIHFFLSNALREIKEVIGNRISAGEPAIDKSPVGPVQPALFSGPEREVTAHFHASGNHVAKKNVGTKVHVMMSVDMRRSSSKQPQEFFRLSGVRMSKFVSQRRII